MKIEFGTDGWRAVIGEEFTFENVRVCAQAVADYLGAVGLAERGLVVGYDTRFASDRFAAAVAEVAAANGIRTALCDAPAPTPVVSYAVLDRHAGGGVVITASHNPGEWNGFKYKPEYAGSATPEIVAALESRIETIQKRGDGVRRVPLAHAERDGLVERFDPSGPYLAQIERLVDVQRLRDAGLTVVVDAMYGAGMGYFRRILEGGSTRVVEIHSELNPLFPDMHNPEPIARNLATLRERVCSEGADIGLATDGDADRIGIVDERGIFVNQLQMYGLLLLYLLDVRGMRGPAVRSFTSTAMADRLGERYGIPVIETPVGFKYVGPKMMETRAIMGGEESGGFGFAGHIPERDAILAGLYALDLMVHRGRPFSGVLEYLTEKAGPSFYDRADITFDGDGREAILRRVERAQPATLDGSRVVAVSDIDGTKFVLEDGSWVLIRFSGTEPLLRVYTETTDQDRVARLLAAGRQIAGV
ncbi:MAG: phosphoglucomutase/phosphomannomutase family protein [Chloroflexi bacterium]|nr:phosphoglucomutase/phosphomannomutase family protein [Chloroflexota bacterium]